MLRCRRREGPILGVSVAARGGAGSSRGFARAVVVTAVLGAAFLLWLLSDLGGPRTRAVVSDLVFVAAPLFPAWTCWRAHRRDRGRHTGWWWLSAGCLTWAAGSVLFAVHQVRSEEHTS